MIIVLHGDDTLEIQRAVRALESKVSGDPGMVDLNCSRLDGKTCSDDDLRSAIGSMPFLAAHRLVILSSPLARATSDATRKRLQALMAQVPESTVLVMVVEDEFERRKWSKLVETHWLRKWIDKAGSTARLQECKLPDPNRMVEWIRKEAQSQGGQFAPDAAAALQNHIGNDTQLAVREVEKLLTYVNFARAVTAEDVEELTTQTTEADIFKMIDALAGGNARQAVKLLHRLMEDEDPFLIFGMIVRQFRLILQMRSLMDEGNARAAGQKLGLRSQFQIDNVATQARRFSFAQLTDIYRRLLEIDEQIKTSQTTWELAFDIFVAELGK